MYAPFAYESPVWSYMTLNLWRGNYIANAGAWANDVPAYPLNAVMNGGFSNSARGVFFNTATRAQLFTIPTGTWDNNAAGTLVIHMEVTSTTNKTMWGKQTASTNGMAVDFTNNPIYAMRAPSSSQGISATVNRGTSRLYSVGTNGGADGVLYQDKTLLTSTFTATGSMSWNNGYNFTFGYGFSWTDASITGYLSRLLFFNKKLTQAEVAQVYDFCFANP